MKDHYYITTPIYYVNDVPHIGHAYTSIVSDIIARFMRLNNKNVLFLTGTDEHGQKIQKSAAAKGLDPQIFADQTSAIFRQLLVKMNISNDDFIRTTEARHQKSLEHFWLKLQQNANIYLGSYQGWYSVRDEAFYDQSELLPGGLAPTGAPVEWIEESSYFFKLSQWQDQLLAFYAASPDFIRPRSRYNEVISFVQGGLKDLSISRTSCRWGIPVPNDPAHTIYVWLDALVNYLSALNYPDLKGRSKFWPADLQVIGKDILRFHAVYWPAFLMAAGLELPKCIMAHGWWTNEGQKISKSVGNVIEPFGLIEEFGLDYVRYFLAREITFGADGNYSRQSLINRVNSELANKIGNLMHRVLAFFAGENHSCTVPEVAATFINLAYTLPLLSLASQLAKDNIKLMNNFEINSILSNIICLADQANTFVDFEAPWRLKKAQPAKMLEVLYTALEALRYIAIMLQPFTPDAAGKMLDQLGVSQDQRGFEHLTKNHALTAGALMMQPEPIFPRIVI